jgi:uncharacterized MnhB-related membrane protein
MYRSRREDGILRKWVTRFVAAKRTERKKFGITRRTGLQQQYRLFMWIATALWLMAAIAAVIDRDTLNAVAWFGFVAAGALTASGATERSRGLAYLAIALLVAAVAILMGVFLAD